MVPHENPAFSQYLKFEKTDDLIMQIVGNDTEKIRLSTARLDGFNPWGIDLNMGCFLKKITCHGWGVAMMGDIRAAESVITEARKATARPLSVKIRIGRSNDLAYLMEFGRMIEASGADFIVLHARTESDGLTRPAKWDYIARLKDAVKIPVVGNGDVNSLISAKRMFDETGCDGLMIGRAAVVSPWIFRDIRDFLDGKTLKERPDLCDVMIGLSVLVEKWFDHDTAVKRFRLALFWLAQNLKFGHHFMKLIKGPCIADMRTQINAAFASGLN
jgi:tRNA-dihydrouridine synthase B